jgi:hypothetical protein
MTQTLILLLSLTIPLVSIIAIWWPAIQDDATAADARESRLWTFFLAVG